MPVRETLKWRGAGTVTLAVGLVLFLLSGRAPAAAESGKHQPARGGAATVPLIPRKVLFGNPDKAAPRLSPDGKRLGFLAPVDGVLNVWVGPADHPEAAGPVTQEKKRGIRVYFFAYDGKHLLYLQDKDGNENYHLYEADLEGGGIRDLTPLENVRAEVQEISYKRPGELLVGLNARDPRYHDIYRVDLASGERSLVLENQGFAGFVTDDDFRIRFAERMTPDGGQEILRPTGEGKDLKWQPFITVGLQDAMTTHIAGFDKSGQSAYLIDSRGRNTSALARLDLLPAAFSKC